MLIQVKNQILRIESISFAEISFPDADAENDWIELRLIIDGASEILYSDEAVMVWHTLQRNAISFTPAHLNSRDTHLQCDQGPHWGDNRAIVPQIRREY